MDTFCTKCDTEGTPGLALAADLRAGEGDAAGEASLFGGFGDLVDILVGAGGFFGGAAHGPGADEDAPSGKFIDEGAALPVTEGFVAAHRSAGAMRRRREGHLLALRCAREDVGPRAHAAADDDGL